MEKPPQSEQFAGVLMRQPINEAIIIESLAQISSNVALLVSVLTPLVVAMTQPDEPPAEPREDEPPPAEPPPAPRPKRSADAGENLQQYMERIKRSMIQAPRRTRP